jgi:aconitate hydratase
VTPAHFAKRYADVFKGDGALAAHQGRRGQTYAWDDRSTYIARTRPIFEGMAKEPAPVTDIRGARAGAPGRLDHHRPHLARRLDQEGRPGGQYLTNGVQPRTSTPTARAAATTR